MMVGLNVNVIPNIRKEHRAKDVFRQGFIYGFVVYAVFAGCFGAVFKEYTIDTCLMDIIWGSVSYGLIALLSSYI